MAPATIPNQGPGTTISNEYHPQLNHIHDTLCYAKTSRSHSIGFQFFIVHATKGGISWSISVAADRSEGCIVFGRLFESFKVLDAIATTETSPGIGT